MERKEAFVEFPPECRVLSRENLLQLLCHSQSRPSTVTADNPSIKRSSKMFQGDSRHSERTPHPRSMG
jgi:hypothetical protein